MATVRRRKRRLKKKYKILFTIFLVAVVALAVALVILALQNRGGDAASSDFPSVSTSAAPSLPEEGSSEETSSGDASSSQGNANVSSGSASSSSKQPSVSSSGGATLTGIYQGIQWRSPTAVPCTFKYGRNLMLVNNYYELPEDFQWNLVYFGNGKAVTAQELAHWDDNGWNYTPVVDAEAYGPLKQMFADAKAAGVPLALVSSFRSIKLQDALFDDYVEANMNKGMSREEAIKAANSLRTYAGTSEHNTGLCFDLAEEGSGWLREGFENTAQGKWLRENAPKYGFILRYPKDKTEITGISYEPWHFRYVGVEHAQKITQQGMCLEEYIESLGGA